MDKLHEGTQHACCVDFDGNGLLILGKSGSGKSTLANLVTRFYDVNEGSITIDGENVLKVMQEFAPKTKK